MQDVFRIIVPLFDSYVIFHCLEIGVEVIY